MQLQTHTGCPGFVISLDRAMAPRPETIRTTVAGSTSSSPLPGFQPEQEVTAKNARKNGNSNRHENLPLQKVEKSPTNGPESAMVAPDGGWGWAVLFGTMLVNVVVIGQAKSFGVYFKILMQEFDATPSKVAWLQALYYSMFSFLSPFVSVISQRVGPRRVALFGGLFSCFGMILSAYTPSLQFLYIFYGVCQGIGLTCTFTPGITMIAKYFNKRRGLANGLAFAGNALGGMLIPLVVDVLIANYELRGCFLIMGAILLHACVGAMLWQPVEWHQTKKSVTEKSYSSTSQYDHLKSTDCFVPIILDTSEVTLDNSPTSMEYLVAQCPNKRSPSDPDLSSRTSMDVDDLYSVFTPIGKCPPFVGVEWKPSSIHSIDVSNCKLQRNSSSPHLGEHFKSIDRTFNSTESLPIMHKLSPRILRLRDASRTSSSFLYLSSYNLGLTAGAVLTKEHFTVRDSVLYKAKSTQSVDIASTDKKAKKRRWTCCLWLDDIKIDTSIFQKSRFYIMTVCLFFHVLGYYGTLMFLPYRATSLGFSQSRAALLLSVLALTDLTGRISCAWLSDFHVFPRKYWFIGGMFFSGIFAFALPCYKSYAALLLGTAGFGASCGAYIGLLVVLFADAYEPEKVALAYSVSTISGGFMAIGGPPLIGYVLEKTGSYLICQCILGSAQVAGAAVWVVEPWALAYEKRRAEERAKKSPEEEQLV